MLEKLYPRGAPAGPVGIQRYLTDLGCRVLAVRTLAGRESASQAMLYLVTAEGPSLNALNMGHQDLQGCLHLDDEQRLVSFALKAAHPHDRDRLAREGKILQKLASEHNEITRIPIVLRRPVTESRLDILPINYLPGINLHRAFLDPNAPQPTISDSDRISLVGGMWANIERFHAPQVAHRDLRLANMMVAPVGRSFDWSAPVTLDFGRAFHSDVPLLDDTGQARASSIYTTPGWAAPRRSSRASSRTFETERLLDIYYWGINSYMLYYGRSPFPSRSDEAAWLTAKPAEAAAMHRRLQMDAIPEPLRPAVLCALRHDPSRRDSEEIRSHLAPLVGRL